MKFCFTAHCDKCDKDFETTKWYGKTDTYNKLKCEHCGEEVLSLIPVKD